MVTANQTLQNVDLNFQRLRTLVAQVHPFMTDNFSNFMVYFKQKVLAAHMQTLTHKHKHRH